MQYRSNLFFWFKISFVIILLSSLSQGIFASPLVVGDSTVNKSIYPDPKKKKSSFYNRLWGEHYRNLYYVPIRVPSTTLNSFKNGVNIYEQANNFHGLVVEDKQNNLYLLKLLGGSTSFLESDFFREMYNRKDFKGTYLDSFIGDVYTIINPYTFVAADHLAENIGLKTNPSQIYYIPNEAQQDTISGGWPIQDKLVNISELPDINTQANIMMTGDMLDKMKDSCVYQVDEAIYIRSRLFDILIGDWNKLPENWNWEARRKDDKIIFTPIVIDRNHAFTKVDGLFLPAMLNALGLGFIENYDGKAKRLAKTTSLGFALDVALVGGSRDSLWIEQAKYIQTKLTNTVIDKAFDRLPPEISDKETDELRALLIKRREILPQIARNYIRLLHKNPVIAGTEQDDRFVIDRFDRDSVKIQIFPVDKEEPYFDHVYSRKGTKVIWIYGVGGNDSFTVTGHSKKNVPVYLISGDGNNEYTIDTEEKIRVYAYESEKEKLDSLSRSKTYFTDSARVHTYDYKKIKYHTHSFTPVGVYDSDYGTSLALFYTYTMYAFKRSPFTYQHRIGYNFLKGFYYQGVFPFYDPRFRVNVDLFLGNPKNFTNFFGFGNNTDGYKDEKKDYNRVYVTQYSAVPSLDYDITPFTRLTFSSGLELHKVKWKDGYFITDYFDRDNPIFDTNYFLDIKTHLEAEKKYTSFLSRIKGTVSAGWKMNLKNGSKNFPYSDATLSIDVMPMDRLTLATMLKGQAIFNNKYEFYQSASTELRGFRDNRFIGKQSFYQYTDLRLDMGTLENPFTPIKYGFFAGFDYGRVWYPGESSDKWHMSYGGGFWLTFINKLTTKYSYFGSSDSFRFSFGLNLDF